MAKRTLTWAIQNGCLTGFTQKTRKPVYSYDLVCDLGTPTQVSEDCDRVRETSSGFLHNDPVYQYLWDSMEDIGLSSVAVRTKQLMDLLQRWFSWYINQSNDTCESKDFN